MAGPNIVLDEVSGFQLTQQGTAGRLYRGFTATDFDTSSATDSTLAFTARDAVIAANGGPNFPGRPEYLLTGIIIRGITNNGFRGQLVFETFSGLQPSVFVVRDASFTATRRVVYSPASGDLFKVDFDAGGGVVIPEDIAHVELDWPMRAISVTATRFGRPPAGLGRAVPSVNDGPWPSDDPYPKGFWKVTSVVSDTNRVQGYYTYQATALTRTTDPWHELVVMQSKLHGRFAKVDAALFKTTFLKPYAFGIDRPAGKGFLRICPYPEVSLTSILPI
jgi:hypothetical protein